MKLGQFPVGLDETVHLVGDVVVQVEIDGQCQSGYSQQYQQGPYTAELYHEQDNEGEGD